MIKLAATTIFLLAQAATAFAEGLGEDMLQGTATLEVVKSTGNSPYGAAKPSLSSSEIAAIQYHEPLSYRCQTREGVFAIQQQRPIDTTCVVNGLPGFMLP